MSGKFFLIFTPVCVYQLLGQCVHGHLAQKQSVSLADMSKLSNKLLKIVIVRNF